MSTRTAKKLTREGKLDGCAIKAVFSNRIVGYSISDRMTAKLAVDAVRNAAVRRLRGGTRALKRRELIPADKYRTLASSRPYL